MVADARLSTFAPFDGDDIDAEVAPLPGIGLGEVPENREQFSALGRVHALLWGDDRGGFSGRDATRLDLDEHDHAAGAMFGEDVGFTGGREQVAAEDRVAGVLEMTHGDVFARWAERVP